MNIYSILFAVLIVIYSVLITFIDGAVAIDEPNLILLGWIGLFQFFLTIYSWLKCGNGLFSIYTVFSVSLFLFSYGQCLIYPFGIDLLDFSLIGYLEISERDIYVGQLYTLLFLAAFHFGALLFSHKFRITGISYQEDCNYGKIQMVGWFFFLISAYPYFSDLIQSLLLSIAYGYSALYGGDPTVGLDTLPSQIGQLLIPSVICLFIGYKNNHLMRNVCLSILLMISILLILSGGRSMGVILLAQIVVMYNYCIKPISKKGVVLLLISAIGLLSVLSAIEETRNDYNRSLSDIKIEQSYEGVVNTVAEMGLSMSCLIKTQELVPESENYRYGKTYLYSFTTIIPNLGFWKYHPAKKEANMSEWLTEKMGLSYGTGFSTCAEAYINFGFWGWLMMMLLGYVLAGLSSIMEKAVKANNCPMIIFSLIMLVFILKLPRNNFIGIVRPFFYYALPLYYLCKK